MMKYRKVSIRIHYPPRLYDIADFIQRVNSSFDHPIGLVHDHYMVDYVAEFAASFARVTEGPREQAFFDRFYDRFVAADDDVAAKFKDTDFKRQKQMLRESLLAMQEFCSTLKSNPYILTLARIHGVRGHDVSKAMFDLWLDTLVQTVVEIDPECNERVELAWRIVMSPGIEFMKFYRDR